MNTVVACILEDAANSDLVTKEEIKPIFIRTKK